MLPKLRLGKLSMLLLPLFVMAFSFFTNVSLAQTSSATVTTDKDDYPPGSTVYITGSGFSPNENVTLQVIHEGETGDNAISGAHAPWTVSADANGNISAQWTVPFDEDELGATLKLTADGQDSKLHAEWTFTDGAATLTSASISAQSGSASYGINNQVISYTITVNRLSNGNESCPISINGLPSGVTSNIAANTTINFSGQTSSINFTLQLIVGSSANAVTSSSFTVVISGGLTGTGQNKVSTDQTITGSLTINKAVLTIKANNQTVPYGTSITDVTGAGSFTPSGFVNNEGASVIGGTATYTTTYTATTTAGTTGITITPVVTNLTASNYSFTAANGTIAISKADQTISFSALSNKSYGDADFAPGATASSGLAVSYSSNNENVVTIVNGKIHIVGAGSATITASQDGDGNYNAASSVQQTLKVNKAAATVSLSNLAPTYTGSSLAATTTTNPSGLKVDITYDGNTTAPTNAGSYKVVGTINDINYQGSATGTLVIDKASSTVTVVPVNTTYDGTAHGTTASVSGAGGLNSALDVTYSGGSAPINAGSYTASASYAGDANHYNSKGSAAIDIAQAAATISVSDLNKVYNGSKQGATVTTAPANLAVSITFAGSATVPTDAGSYAVVVKLNNDNYKATDGSGTLFIDKATPSVSIDQASLSATYDGNVHEAIATVTGVNQTTLTGVTISYSKGTPPVSVSSPINAGDYTVEASYTGDNNYYPASQSGTLKIKKADQTITVTTPAPSSATYNTGFTVAATASSDLQVTYTSVAPLSNTDATYTMTSGTGTGTVKINQAGDDNYNPAPEVTANVTAVKANQTISWATPTAITYPTALSATQLNATTSGDGTLTYSPGLGTILGAGDQTLRVTAKATDNFNEATESVTLKVDKGTPTISWSNPTGITYGTALSATQLNADANVSGSFTYTPAIGEYLHAGKGQKLSVNFTPSDGDNYNGGSKDVTIDVAKADPSITVNGYSGTYDGNAHGATVGTAVGARGEDLSKSISLGSSFTNVPGGTANWNFTGDDNHNPANGTASIVLDKAPSSVAMSNISTTYDGKAHEAAATATGVGGLNTSTNITYNYKGTGNTTYSSTTAPANAGTYSVTATYGGDGNHESNSAAASITIAKADQTITWATPSAITYPTALSSTQLNATVVGVKDGSDPGVLSYTPASGAILGAGARTLSVTAAETDNYNEAKTTVALQVDKSTPTIVWNNPTGITYGDALNTTQLNATANVKGSFTYSPVAGTLLNAGSGQTLSVSFTPDDADNYNATNKGVTIDVAKADSKVNVTIGGTFTYNGSSQAIQSATVSGVTINGTPESLGNAVVVYKQNSAVVTPINAGTYNVSASFAGDNNYNPASDNTKTMVIEKANQTITWANPAGITYGTALSATQLNAAIEGVTGGSAIGTVTYTPVVGTVLHAGSAQELKVEVGATSNYNAASQTIHIDVDKATPTINLTVGDPVIYDGKAHSVQSATIVTVNSDVLTPTVTYKDVNNTVVAGPTNAGSYAVSASFAGNDDYYAATTQTGKLIINKATATVTLGSLTPTYTGSSLAATATTTPGSLMVNFTYNGNAQAPSNAGSYTVVGTISDVNYQGSATGTLVIGKATPTVNVAIGGPFTYNGAAQSIQSATVTGVNNTSLGDATVNYKQNGNTVTPLNAGTYNVYASFAGDDNYNSASDNTKTLTVDKATASVSPTANSKYCGQSDPTTLTGTLTGFLSTDNVTASYSRTTGETAGIYIISATLSPNSVLSNYYIDYKTANFTINGITSIDASASSNPVALGSPATLSATISPAVSGVVVTFNVDPGTGVITSYTATTNSSGVATTSISGPALNVNVYKITAFTGSGCATSSAAYLPVYDPNGAFVTGGGWILSPAGAYRADATLTGKANFGFNAQYKKGSNAVDGNTEFQFQAGNLNFKSSNYSAGTLVIAGAKAIFQGTGTINGIGTYNFMVSAIDGDINGGIDKFRIKIWTASGDIVYDNNIANADNNADPATAISGGSIVIHQTKTTTKATTIALQPGRDALEDQSSKLKVTALPNPSTSQFTLQLQSNDKQQEMTMIVVNELGKVMEMKQHLTAGQTIQIGSNYRPGAYYVRVIQGKQSEQVQLMKLTN